VSLTNNKVYEISAAHPNTVTFNLSGYQFSESAGSATINVTRPGDTAGAASVDYMTVDDPAAVPCNPNDTPQRGIAYARCDYVTTIETVNFAPGETDKTITVPLINDAHVEGNETFVIKLLNPVNTAVGFRPTATITILDDDTPGQPNPIFQTPFFVRLHYLDFLSREPEAGEPWSGVLNGCPDPNNVDPNSPSARCDRITVSAAFFGSPEFRLKGYFVFLFYKVAFGAPSNPNYLPAYSEIIPDMRAVTGQTAAEVFQKKAAFTEAFPTRLAFRNSYDTLSNAAYVDTLLGHYSLTAINTPDPANPDGSNFVLLTRGDLLSRLNSQTLTRGQVLRAIAQSREVDMREFNGAFVAMQYYGYLRRTPEQAGYQAWLN